MKVVIFSDTFPPQINGIATSARNLMTSLIAHGVETLVVTTNPYENHFSFKDNIIRIPGIEMKKLYGYKAAGVFNAEAWEIIKKFNPDVCHIQTDVGIGQFGFICVSRLKCASVATFHTSYEDYTYYATKGYFDRFAKNAVRIYVRMLSNRADEFISPSDKTREYMRSIGVDCFVNVIPTGIDFSIYKDEAISQKRVEEIKKKFDIPEDAYVILSLGRVAKEKSIDICLKGYSEYLKNGPEAKTIMVIVGGGPALDGLKELSAELGIKDHVRFVGPVNPDDVPTYYKLGNCFVSASITETQGLTFMEAMAAKLVLFCRFDDTLTNTITEGVNGFFFLDEFDFAKKLGGIIALKEPTLRMIHDEERKSIEPYSLERFGDNAIEVYKRAIKKKW